MKKILIPVFLFLFPLLHAQNAPMPSQDHLSNPLVSCMTEDGSGNIWIGTSRGLNKYNGSSYIVYYQEENGLLDDLITSLCTDADGTLWVATGSGIQAIRRNKVDPTIQIRSNRVSHVRVWDDGHLLFSNREGLFMADKKTGEIRPVYLDRRLLYNRFLITSDRHIWIRNLSTDNLIVLDSGFRICREFQVSGHDIAGGYEYPGMGICLFTTTGILCFGPYGTPAQLPQYLTDLTRGRNVLFMCGDDEVTFLGIHNEGIFSVTGGEVRKEWEFETLGDTGQHISFVTQDNLWLSKGGQELSNYYRHMDEYSIQRPAPFSADALNMFYPLGNGYILVITNKGVFRQHIGSGSYTILNGDGIDGNDKLGITLRDRFGNLWIQHNYEELRRYTVKGDRLELETWWQIEPTNSIWDDATGNVYLLQSTGISCFTQDGRRREITTTSHPEFWFCGQFESGKVYFLSSDAIWFLDDNFRFVKFETDIPEPCCIWEDSAGDWWIGTRHAGIWRYSPKENSARQIHIGGSDVDQSIQSIRGDQNGTVWASSRFDYIQITEKGEKIRILHNPDQDLISNNTNSLAVTENGTAIFGTPTKFFFFPSDISDIQPDIPLSLDGLTINGETTLRDISGPVTLDHRTHQLVFYFSGKNFNPAIQPSYQYRLDDYDAEWVAAGQTLQARYSRLLPRRYTFRVRVQQADGDWDPDELNIPIRIKPSPWVSWQAFLFYLLLLLGLAFFAMQQFIRFRVNREKLEITEQEKLLVEQISQERSTFFTNVSHEFRTPLSLIYGPIRELQKSPTLSEKDRKLVRMAERNSERMLRLTDQLLHFNQSQSNRDTLSLIRTDLVVLLRQMLKNFEYMFTQKDLRVTTELPPEMIVYCDREKVERIIFNLLSNAVKYTPEHGEITVSAVTEGTEARISVADTGIGINPEKRDRIFERYERLGEQVGGTLPTGFGIGLNYARHLAEVHKGDLSVMANEPIGSIFTFAFPYRKEDYAEASIWEEEAASQPAEATAEGTAAPAGDKTGANILVVEDNADMREYIRGFLGESFHVTLAGDGEEAWKVIRISAPDLVVSDVMMPFKDGYTLCKELKNDPDFCHIPVILLTAKADMENQIQGLGLGADGYLGKPFDPAFLTALVNNLLANRRRLQGLLADRTSTTQGDVPEEGITPQDKAFLEKCYRIIDEHIGEEDFGVTVLSMEMGMSRTSIFSKLKSLVGQSPQTFLTNYRLNRAMELLKAHELNVSEVAYKVGFGTLTGFSRAFKNKFGVPPSQV